MLNALQFKKSILLASFSLLCSDILFAQDAKVKFSIQIGATVSKFAVTAQSPTSEYKGPYRIAPGFYLGAVMDLPVLKTWSLGTSLKAIGKTIRVKGDPIGSTFQDKGVKSFIYAELPVQILKHFELGKTPVFIGAGGYVSYLISGNEYQEWNAYNGDTMAFNLFKNRDAGLIFTFGSKISNNMSIVAGYELGMKDVLNNQLDFSPERTRLKTRSFTMGIQASL
jgi:hypothetical protein